jgi:hypothetical protein
MGEEGELYAGAYVDSTYGDRMRQTFERIINLPPERSDNAGRVRRVNEFVASRRPGLVTGEHRPTVLDVGSGLCVFLRCGSRLGRYGSTPTSAAARRMSLAFGPCAPTSSPPTGWELSPGDVLRFWSTSPICGDAHLPRTLEKESGFVYVELPTRGRPGGGPGREDSSSSTITLSVPRRWRSWRGGPGSPCRRWNDSASRAQVHAAGFLTPA